MAEKVTKNKIPMLALSHKSATVNRCVSLEDALIHVARHVLCLSPFLSRQRLSSSRIEETSDVLGLASIPHSCSVMVIDLVEMKPCMDLR